MKTLAPIAWLAAAALAAAPALGCQGEGARRRNAAEGSAAASVPPAAAPDPTPAPAPAPTAEGLPAPTAGSAGSAGPAPLTKEYAGDIGKLCDVMQLSNAINEPEVDPRLTTAQWLAANLATQESRLFLARIQPLDGAAKADALEAEARRVGLSACALAADWRKPAP